MATTFTDRVLGVSTSSAIKKPCRVATTAAIALSGTQTIDTISVVENDRVLVKDQVDQKQNGIYIVSESAWTRAKDFNDDRDVERGTLIYVAEGSVNQGIFQLTTANAVNISTDDIVFSSANITADNAAQLAEDWAISATIVNSEDFSSKQYAVGTPPDGSAKEWATEDEDVAVAGGEFSAKHYSIKAAAAAATADIGDINGLAAETPVAADEFLFADASDSNNAKKVTGANLAAYIAGEAKTTTVTTNIDAGTSAGGSGRSSAGSVCFSWGGGAGQNFTVANTLSFGAGGATVDSVLDEDDMSSDSDTALATQQSIKAFVTFSKSFESAEQTISNNGTLTLAHGLGEEPKIIQVFAICKTAEYGWSIGDKIRIDDQGGANAACHPFINAGDTANVGIKYGGAASPIQIPDKTSGVKENLTVANWRLIVRAYA